MVNTVVIHTPDQQFGVRFKSRYFSLVTVRINIRQIVSHRVKPPLLGSHAAGACIPSSDQEKPPTEGIGFSPFCFIIGTKNGGFSGLVWEVRACQTPQKAIYKEGDDFWILGGLMVFRLVISIATLILGLVIFFWLENMKNINLEKRAHAP
jgi:hypothetical protein